MMRICTMLRTVVHTTWPFDSKGSSFNFFSMIGVGEVGRLLFATIGSWSGGIGSVGNWVSMMNTKMTTIIVMLAMIMITWAVRFCNERLLVEVIAEVEAEAEVDEDAAEELEVNATFR